MMLAKEMRAMKRMTGPDCLASLLYNGLVSHSLCHDPRKKGHHCKPAIHPLRRDAEVVSACSLLKRHLRQPPDISIQGNVKTS